MEISHGHIVNGILTLRVPGRAPMPAFEGAGRQYEEQRQRHAGSDRHNLHAIDGLREVAAQEETDREPGQRQQALDDGKCPQRVPQALGPPAHGDGADAKAEHEDKNDQHRAECFAAAEEALERPLPDDLVDETGAARCQESGPHEQGSVNLRAGAEPHPCLRRRSLNGFQEVRSSSVVDVSGTESPRMRTLSHRSTLRRPRFTVARETINGRPPPFEVRLNQSLYA